VPLLAYINRGLLPNTRKSFFHVHPNPKGGENTPVANLHRLRARALVPKNLDCDASLVAILVAIAQARFYSGNKLVVPMHDVEMRLFTFDAAAEHFIVYTAWIGADFLEGFDKPSQPLHRGPKGTSSMRVSHIRVPAWPFFGLKERLGMSLGSEITGKRFSSVGYDTFHTPEELPSYRAELKRIRIGEDRRNQDLKEWEKIHYRPKGGLLSKRRRMDDNGAPGYSSRSSKRQRI
jgi:hypothetical protein